MAMLVPNWLFCTVPGGHSGMRVAVVLMPQ